MDSYIFRSFYSMHHFNNRNVILNMGKLGGLRSAKKIKKKQCQSNVVNVN